MTDEKFNAAKFFREAGKEYLVVFFMSVSVVFSGSLIAPVEQRFISTLTGNTVLMGSVFTLGTLSIVIASLFFGKFSRVYGRNRLIILGAVFGIVYPLIYATSTSIFQYIGGKILYGVSGAAMGPLLVAYLQDHLSTSKNKGMFLGYLYSTQSIAGSAGAIFGGILADRYSLNFPYYVQAAVLAIPFFLAIRYLKTDGKSDNRPAAKYFFIIKRILSNPYLVYHLTLEIPYRLNWAVKVVLYPLTVIYFINLNAVTGSIFATQGAVAMVVLLFAGNFVDKRSYMMGMKTAFLILAAASLLMALSTNLPMFWLGAGLLAVGEAVSGPAKGVLEIENISPDYRAEALAVISTVGYFIEAFSPFLAGILLIWLKPQTVLLVYSLMIWFFLAAATIMLKTRLKIYQQ